MQFELSTRELDAAMIATALRPLDPDARVALDVASGHLEVLSPASAAQVLGVLDPMGCVSTPLSQAVHISGGSTCCGTYDRRLVRLPRPAPRFYPDSPPLGAHATPPLGNPVARAT